MNELHILSKSNGQFRDLRGQTFGRWKVVDYDQQTRRWNCLCSCGIIRQVLPATLVGGESRSCGCGQRQSAARRMTKHGAHDASGRSTREYAAWRAAKNRCANPRNRSYPHYGGRGITMCEAWLKYENFLSDMGKCPPGLTLDRIDNNGNYEPGNCRWASVSAQANNRRTNRILHHEGLSLTVSQWSARTGISTARIIQRIKKGWSTQRALETPVSKRKRCDGDLNPEAKF